MATADINLTTKRKKIIHCFAILLPLMEIRPTNMWVNTNETKEKKNNFKPHTHLFIDRQLNKILDVL